MRWASKYGGLLAALVLAAASAAAGPPSVYHSAADDGVDPGGSVTIAEGQTTLHLYLDGGSVASSSGPCTQGVGDGDEVCGWKLHLEGQAGLGLVSFTPSGDVVFGQNGTTLFATGGNPSTGTLGPSKIGDLVVDGVEGALALLASDSISASQALETIPAATIVAVPEPGAFATLVAGCALLGLLHGRRVRGRH